MVRALQIFWSLGVAFWNLYGLSQLEQGLRAPGPTASLSIAIAGMILCILFWSKWLEKLPLLYIAVSIICTLLAGFIIYGSFTKDPSLWPSEAWRWGGILLNSVGALSCLAGIVRCFNET